MGQRGSGGRHGRVRCTTEDSAVCGKEAVLERLLQVALLEGFLLGYDLVQVLAGIDGYLVTTVAVVNAEESQALVSLGGLALYSSLEVEDAGMGILHADAPALHRGGAEDVAVVMARLGFLGRISIAQVCVYACAARGRG